ncbi:MAG: hypothetical protein J5476_17290 [Lachnospiraceae bacterium]|nr:hypothetical protein [Lachnospiraceae bacterium]
MNIFGLIIVLLILVPNIIYAIRVKDQENKCQNKIMNILEQIGRYGCMFLMAFNIGIAEFGFKSVGMVLAYLFGNAILLVSYWVIWILYFRKPEYPKQISLAVIPTIIFILSGITTLHVLLIVFGIIFGLGHIYVTRQNKL